MEHKSEYSSSLSASAKDRYERKVMATGLKVDPYSIECWHKLRLNVGQTFTTNIGRISVTLGNC